MRRFAPFTAMLLATMLPSCVAEPTPEEAAAEADREVAIVEQANRAPPPARQIVPDAISAPEIMRHQLTGAGCSYAPGTSLGARVIARKQDAWMKLDGKLVRFAADPGAGQLAAGSWNRYLGAGYELQLTLADGERHRDGTVSLRDAHGREVYRGTGTAQCQETAA
ncbi:hypothetical protein V5740_04565 [Croceibacterium sp. TMG7-5b_MA50]|uniref:hypothetical protein n=1 Tax=Croceibacterium sp. TMG7-5b_MA50 TaxID=3121290 RepID=UPI003221BE1A